MDLTKESKISLNRIFFLPEKKLKSNTPYFVIEFVAKSIGIKFDFSDETWKRDPDEIIDPVNKALDGEDICISIENIESHLPDIATFVNPETSVQWKSSKILKEAFKNIFNFTPKIPLLSSESFGYKTESTPYHIDPIMVYQIAYKYGIPVDRETTISDIQGQINNYSARLTPLKMGILDKIRETLNLKTRKGLIEMARRIDSESPTVNNNENFPQRYPQTIEEAIQRTASEHRWDISMSNFPIEEYIELDRIPNEKYRPVDEKWGKIFDVNRKFFNLDFRYIEKYDPYYTEEKKKMLIYQNGGSTNSDYLVLGLHPLFQDSTEIDKCKTIINLDKISSDYIERYRKIISTPFFACTREELCDIWNERKTFVSPDDVSVSFSEKQIEMIKINCETNDRIISVIDKIRKYRIEKIQNSFEYCSKHKNANIMFRMLLSVGMSIRGYKTCYDDYPLEQSSYDIEIYQDIIEKRTSLKVVKLLQYAKDFFDHIPVFTGRNILGEPKKGYNIQLYGGEHSMGDIIKRLGNPDEVEGCMRTNSNYILVTSWYYLTNVYDDSPFDIGCLRFIS